MVGACYSACAYIQPDKQKAEPVCVNLEKPPKPQKYTLTDVPLN